MVEASYMGSFSIYSYKILKRMFGYGMISRKIRDGRDGCLEVFKWQIQL